MEFQVDHYSLIIIISSHHSSDRLVSVGPMGLAGRRGSLLQHGAQSEQRVRSVTVLVVFHIGASACAFRHGFVRADRIRRPPARVDADCGSGCLVCGDLLVFAAQGASLHHLRVPDHQPIGSGVSRLFVSFEMDFAYTMSSLIVSLLDGICCLLFCQQRV